MDFSKKAGTQEFIEDYKPSSHEDVVPRQRKTTEEKRADLQAAQQVDPGMDMMSWRAVKFTLMVIVVCLCGGDSGKFAAD
jgi:hypothetical protein